MEIKIPKLSLVVLIGVSGSGKSTFARTHFKSTEVLSSDTCRGLVSDDENDQAATKDAFEVLHFIAAKRLAAGRLAVIDATNVQIESRKPLIELARRYHALPVAIVFDLPEKICQARNKLRPDRNFGSHVVLQQSSQLKRSIRNLKHEGFRHIFTLTDERMANDSTLVRVPLWNDKTDVHGPFDIIGDLHGCRDELVELLTQLGYSTTEVNKCGPVAGPVYAHPQGRTAIFLGDLTDRGPRILDSFTIVYNMVKAGTALCVPGNHDIKLQRKLSGKDVQITHGLGKTLEEIERLPAEAQGELKNVMTEFIDGLISHYVLDDGRLVVAHAGLKEEMQGRGSGKVREFCLFGETTGETDEFGLPVRLNWAAEYRGRAMVVYGHTPTPEAQWLNRTINIDTGCVFGGRLTALRYPEKELVSVAAREIYCAPVRPLETAVTPDVALSIQQTNDDVLDAEDVLGKRLVQTRLRGNVTIREENAAAALEVMSRFAADPKWLIYLPPTMSPSETSTKEGYLERPEEAFSYFRSNGVPKVICEKKHMGSRAVVIICRDEKAAAKAFGVQDGGAGIVYTRTGRRFFDVPALEAAFLERIRKALGAADFWTRYETEWVCLDCELMPWSEKAQDLLKNQYAAVGAAASASLSEAIETLRIATARTEPVIPVAPHEGSEGTDFDTQVIHGRYKSRLDSILKYIDAYRAYCWPVRSLEDLKLAPFHLLATEGKVYFDRDHEWHMSALADLCRHDSGILMETPYLVTDTTVEDSLASGAEWWAALTREKGEGMVIKPYQFIATGKKGLVQPAVKCRGREYLRIIYGAEYTEAHNLERLRARSLGTKRSLAVREFALGVESLERFVRKEPLRRVHECVFGVLAMESEPVDPRL